MAFKVGSDEGNSLGLPQDLGNGLTLRWAKPKDSAASSEFNGRILGEEGAPDEGIAFATQDWMSGKHPTVRPGDFTLVVDENQRGKIVSSMTLVSQTWAYDGIEFKVGRPEAIGTDPEYRRRGLVRQQFQIMHARSAERGELMQVIGGIPWYYHQFGYDLALAVQGERELFWVNSSQLEGEQTENYRLRPATHDDIKLLSHLYAIHCASSLITQLRSEAEWHFILTDVHPQSLNRRRFLMVEDRAGKVVGYLGLDYLPEVISIREMAVLPGYPMRLVAEFVTRALQTLSNERATENKSTASSRATFTLETSHPACVALSEQLNHQKPSSAWYVRIPDLPAFLRHIAPALNKRLQSSVFDGYSGTLHLNFYLSGLTLVLKSGKLTEVETTAHDESDAAFPGPTFLQLVLGYRSLSDLEYADSDCTVSNERSRVLLNALFPQRPSSVAALA